MSFPVRALYAYQSEQSDDLPFNEGQEITVTEVLDEEWYAGTYTAADGKVLDGIFPINYVEKIEVAKPAAPATPHSRPNRASKVIEAGADTDDWGSASEEESEKEIVLGAPTKLDTTALTPPPASTETVLENSGSIDASHPAEDKPEPKELVDEGESAPGFKKPAESEFEFEDEAEFEEPESVAVASESQEHKAELKAEPAKKPRAEIKPENEAEAKPESAEAKPVHKSDGARPAFKDLRPTETEDEGDPSESLVSNFKSRMAIFNQPQEEKAKPDFKPPPRRTTTQFAFQSTDEDIHLENKPVPPKRFGTTFEPVQDDEPRQKSLEAEEGEDGAPRMSLKERIQQLQQRQEEERRALEEAEERLKQKQAERQAELQSRKAELSQKQAATAGSVPVLSGEAEESGEPGEPGLEESDDVKIEDEVQPHDEEVDDEEEARKIALRERMARLHGGVGGFGLGGPPRRETRETRAPRELEAMSKEEREREEARLALENAQPVSVMGLGGGIDAALMKRLGRAEPEPEEIAEEEDTGNEEEKDIGEFEIDGDVQAALEMERKLSEEPPSPSAPPVPASPSAPPVPPSPSAPPVPASPSAPPVPPSPSAPPVPPSPSAPPVPTSTVKSAAATAPVPTVTAAPPNPVLAGAPPVPVARPAVPTSTDQMGAPPVPVVTAAPPVPPDSTRPQIDTVGSREEQMPQTAPIPAQELTGPSDLADEEDNTDSEVEVPTSSPRSLHRDIPAPLRPPAPPVPPAPVSRPVSPSSGDADVDTDVPSASPASPASPARPVHRPPPPAPSTTAPPRAPPVPSYPPAPSAPSAPSAPPAPYAPPAPTGSRLPPPIPGSAPPPPVHNRPPQANAPPPPPPTATRPPPTPSAAPPVPGSVPQPPAQPPVHPPVPPAHVAPPQPGSRPPPPAAPSAPPAGAPPAPGPRPPAPPAVPPVAPVAAPSSTSASKAGLLDLSSNWHTQPRGVPPALKSMKHVVYEVEESETTKRGGRVLINRDIYILRSDLSQTVINLSFDKSSPDQAQIDQHEEAPPHIDAGVLKAAAAQFGSAIVATAAKRPPTDIAAVKELLSSVKGLLPPLDESFGYSIYENFGSSVHQIEELRPGDIAVFDGAHFQGSKSPLQKYHRDISGAFIVSAWDGIKKKLLLVDTKKDTVRLNDLRSGSLRIYRALGRNVVGWE